MDIRHGRWADLGDLLKSVMKFLTKSIFWLWTTWYILCRAFIVVECFIMLAHLPDTTLEIPQWATYVPHITWEQSPKTPAAKEFILDKILG
jgi:hypothetical protein